MSFVAAVMLGGAAVLTAVMPARAADVMDIEAVEAMFETENTAEFSLYEKNNNIIVRQKDDTPVTAASTTAANATHNQTTTITYKNPIYIGDNSDEVPFFTYSVVKQDKNGKRDFDAMIVTLTDAEDATNQVSVLIGFWNVTNSSAYSTVYAKGSNQSFYGYHYGSNHKTEAAAPVNQGTVTDGVIENYPDSVWELYYDNDTKKVHMNFGMPQYSDADRDGVFTNGAGKKLTTVRDLTDNTTTGLTTETPYTKGMETAYLSVTTVRGWYTYNGIGTSSIYSGPFRGGSSAAHTLSDTGAQYMIRSIDGLNFGLTDGTLADSKLLYFAESFSGSGDAEIPVLNRYTVLGGIEEDKAYTEGLYIKVKNRDADVTVQGLSDGKWTEGCGFAGEKGTYTVNYYADSAYETLVASVTVTLYRPAFDTAEEIVAPNVFKGDGSSTFGWEIFRVGNSSLYSGVTVSTAAAGSVTYTKDIKISDNTEDDVLLQFIAIPNEVGVHDFTSITFKFIDKNNPDNYFTVNLGEGGVRECRQPHGGRQQSGFIRLKIKIHQRQR